MESDTKRWVRTAAITVAAVAVAGTVAALLVRDQIRRHQRNLFHPSAFRRVAALEHLSRQRGTVDALNLLRDYMAWEPRRMLRTRAEALLLRMAEEVSADEHAEPSGRSSQVSA
jgi:2-methylaconitate cis-trans-isomerase PrpF